MRRYPHLLESGRVFSHVSELDSVTSLTVEPSTTILLAEDDPVTRMLMTRFLKKAGYEVDAVANGSQALDKMTLRYYPMLVTDWEMPEMDGIALCKAVRNMQLDGYVYALLLTARDSKEHIIAGLEAGADDYLVKPVHEPELIARLNAGRRILNLEHSLRVANQRNRILSISDALTGTYNRRYLMEQLPRELERCRRYAYPLSVLMCDIDHFKQINDERRHTAGDDVLQQFTARVQKSIRSNSDWVARYGGEEFIVLLRDSPTAGAQAVAERLRATVQDLRIENAGSPERVVTASIGVASAELTDEAAAARMVEDADRALYEAKCAGRNQVKLATERTLDEAAHSASITGRRRRLQR